MKTVNFEHTNKKSIFFKNTLIILLTSIIIKMLGLLNKIIITRLLGESGMSIYIMTFPTVMLLISISGLSLNVTVSKLIAESIKHHRYSPKKLLITSIKFSLVASAITILLLLIILKPLTSVLLKNDNLFFPILASIFLIPLVGTSDALRGYFNGLKQMRTSSISTLIEQFARISFSIIFLLITIPYGPVISTSFCIIALAIGEIASIIYTLIMIKKQGIIDYPEGKDEKKAVLGMAIPTTLSRLIGSFTYFLEPILFTFILLKLTYSKELITSTYTIVNAYVIPLLTMASFVSYALATSIIPGISESYTINDTESVHFYIRKTLIFSLLPSIVTSIVFFQYASEYLNLLYATTSGSEMIRWSVFLIIPYYLQMPFVAILQSIGKAKQVFIISSIIDILRLVLIILLAFIPIINIHSLLVSTISTILISFIIMITFIIKSTKFRFNKTNLFSLFLVFLISFTCSFLFRLLNIHFIIASILLLVITFLASVFLNLISLKNFFKLKERKKQVS